MIKFEELVKGDYCNHSIKFEIYWNLNGQYNWNNKHNAWINWLHTKWNTGLLNITEYRYLINVEFE